MVIGTNNYVFDKVYYLPGAGDGYYEDWNASIYGDLIKINISETDTDNVSNGSSETNEYSIENSFSSQIATEIPIESYITFETESTYSFGEEAGSSATNTITIQAANLISLGDIDIRYCAENNYEHLGSSNHPIPSGTDVQVIDEQNNYLNWWNFVVDE